MLLQRYSLLSISVKFFVAKSRTKENLDACIFRILYITYLGAVFDVVSLVKAEVAQVVRRWPLAGFSGF